MHKLFLLLTITMFGKAYGQVVMGSRSIAQVAQENSDMVTETVTEVRELDLEAINHMRAMRRMAQARNGGVNVEGIENESFSTKLIIAQRLIIEIEDAQNYARGLIPTNSTEAFQLRNSIDHPVDSKNKRLGYCLNGTMPVGRRVQLEIPFKIGRKKACKKSVPKMLEKANHILYRVYMPYFGNAMKLKIVTQSILAEDVNLAFNEPELYMALKRVDQYTLGPKKLKITIADKSYGADEVLNILAMQEDVNTSMGYKDFARIYKRFLDGIDLYSQNFRYEGFNKYIKVLKTEVQKNL